MSTAQPIQPAVAYPTLVGKVIAAERERRGQKQSDLAQELGISQSAYSRLESGDSVLNLAQVRKIGSMFEMTPGQVLARADALELILRSQGVEVLHEKPANPAAVAIGLGILAALLLSK